MAAALAVEPAKMLYICLTKGSDCVVRSCETLLSNQPGGGVDNEVPQLHATQSEPLD